MTRLFILMLVLISCSLYGQDNTVSKSRKFFIGANFSPDYCYRILTQNDKKIPDSLWSTVKNTLDSIELAKFGYTTGIAFGYQFNDLIGIETGILYANKGYKMVPLLIIYDWNKPGVIATNIVSHTYIDFPFRANITVLKKRVQLITSVGVVLNFLVQSSIKIIPETATSDVKAQTQINHYDFKKINLSSILSIGLKYKLNDRISLRAEPTFRYGILNMDDKSVANRHLFNLGLNIGLYFSL